MSNTTRTLGIVAIEPKGEYDATAYYEKLNIVNYNDSIYMAKENVYGENPSTSNKWELIGTGVTNEDVLDAIQNTIEDSLTSESSTKSLSAKQGKILKDLVDSNKTETNRKLNRLINKKIVLIGDSYLEGYNPDGNVTSWGTYFKEYIGIEQVVMSFLGGSSFAGSKPFTNLVNILAADDDVTDVIVAGGFNDRTFSKAQILTGMTSFKTACIAKFPNAKIHLAMIGWSSNPDYIYSLFNACLSYKENASKLGISFLSGTEYSMHDYFTMFASDLIHPTALGQQSIANSLVNAFLNGSTDTFLTYKTVGIEASGSCTAISGSTNNFSAELNNGIVQISSQGRIEFTINNVAYTAGGGTDIEVANITGGYIIGSAYKMCNIPVQYIVHGDGKYHKINGNLIFRNKKLYVNFADINSEGNNYLSFTSIDSIQLFPFSGVFDSLFC